MSSIEFSLLIISLLITAINFNIYKLTKEKYFGVLRQIWRLERFIKEYYIKENYNAPRSEVS